MERRSLWLEEVLDGFGRRIPFNLELKQSLRGPYAGLEALTLQRVEAMGILGQTLFSSFYDPVLDVLRGLAPKARIGVLVSGQAPEGWRERAKRFGAEAVHFWVGLATPDAVAAAHGEGWKVHVYTVDDRDQMRRLIDRGVDGIFTNYPRRMRALLD